MAENKDLEYGVILLLLGGAGGGLGGGFQIGGEDSGHSGEYEH